MDAYVTVAGSQVGVATLIGMVERVIVAHIRAAGTFDARDFGVLLEEVEDMVALIIAGGTAQEGARGFVAGPSTSQDNDSRIVISRPYTGKQDA